MPTGVYVRTDVMRAGLSAIQKRLYADPIVKAQRTAAMKDGWNRPGVKQNFSMTMKAVRSRPEVKAKLSMAAREEMNRPGVRVGKTGSLTPSWKGGLTPEKIRGYEAKHRAKRRGLGYVYLNSWFVGCEGHHVDNDQVIHLPKLLHRSIYHRQSDGLGMAQINAIAYNFLFKQEVEIARKRIDGMVGPPFVGEP